MGFQEDLILRIKAGYPCLYVTAREDWRCLVECQTVAGKLGQVGDDFTFQVWNVVRGWSGLPNTTDPVEALKAVLTGPYNQTRGIYCLVNFHRFLDDPQVIQHVKDLVQTAKANRQYILFISNIQKIPPELKDDLTIMDFGLPGKDLLAQEVDYILEQAKMSKDRLDYDRLTEAALGMTTWEAQNALALSLVQTKMLSPEIIAREKAKAVAKDGVLEFFQPQVSMNDVGGLGRLKEWLRQRRRAFSPEAREYGLPEPKGILLVGPPGVGKSLTAKAVSSSWGIPLLKLDIGKLFQGLVGASEENTRRALATAEAVAPVVLWCDEIQRGLAGGTGSGSTDSGVTSRVIGTILSWLQEKQRPVFMMATANEAQSLPPELMRAGRFDEIFYVDLPAQVEREEILRIHLGQRKRDYLKFKVEYIAKEMLQFSGAEIEKAVEKAMFMAFSEDREVDSDDLVKAVSDTIPLAITRKEEIAYLRQWAQTRAIPASANRPPEIDESQVAVRKRTLWLGIEEKGS